MDEALTRRVLARAAALCLVAGYVDAFGYTELGGVFAANMTGNSVLLAIAALHGEGMRVVSYASTLTAFLAGALVASALRRATRQPLAALLAAAALFVIAAFAPASSIERLALLAGAMGLQGAAIMRFGPASLQTVVVTGTMIRLADSLVEQATVRRADASMATPSLDALAWFAYVAGAALAIAAQHAMARPLILAAAVLLVVAAETAWAGAGLRRRVGTDELGR
jgi:uncharacterized membrane protein YoaK (UPF0700 family)